MAVNESCAALDETCPCGNNAKMCKWTDEWGWEEERSGGLPLGVLQKVRVLHRVVFRCG